MRVEIDENGLMRIDPETPLETFALREWCKASFVVENDLTRMESGHWRGSRLIVIVEMKTPNV